MKEWEAETDATKQADSNSELAACDSGAQDGPVWDDMGLNSRGLGDRTVPCRKYKPPLQSPSGAASTAAVSHCG
jgi:hypothetical protein